MRSHSPPAASPNTIRLDLFLKLSRLVKRRPLAAMLCREGHVTVNGREAGPGHAVRIGDRVGVRLRRERVEVEVLSLPGKGYSADGCYRVTARERVEEE